MTIHTADLGGKPAIAGEYLAREPVSTRPATSAGLPVPGRRGRARCGVLKATE